MDSTIATRLSRRRWIGGVAALLGTSGRSAASQSAATTPAAVPRHVVLMVADGMSVGVPTLAESFSHTVRGRGTAWWELARHPDVTTGWVDTASLTSLVTDSAAAASAWGSGSRVRNGAINVLPDGTRLTPLAHLARQARRRIGLVTTTTVTHATPAGFAAVNTNRNAEDDIATQYLDRVDVVLGGGQQFFDAGRRADGRDLVGDFARGGYAVWRTRDELRAATGSGRGLGLFASEHLPYRLDRDQDPRLQANIPTLAEMASAALARLHDVPEGFFLLVEGGRVDHAAHANDAAAILREQLDFDDAVAAVREFAAGRHDTLVIVTSDHGNANPGLNGMGQSYLDSSRVFANVTRARASFSVVKRQLLDAANRSGQPSVNDTGMLVEHLLGFAPDRLQTEVIRTALARPVVTVLNGQLAGFDGVLGQIAANHWGIGWTGTTHTADLAPVLAFGPGQERFRGLRANTALFGDLVALMGLTFKNPAMAPVDARAYAAYGVAGAEVVPA
ncbi:MAG: hypothetical protein FJW29_11905 [Acidobacteria bacterium]|nr:hypothetical protein [Acidobacteriota bacterium]